MDSKNKNINLVRRLFEEQASKDDVSQYDQLLSQNVCVYGPASGQVIRGITELKKVDISYNRAYPQKKFTIEAIFEYQNKVIVQWICSGKHKEKFKGISPRKKNFNIAGLSIYRITNGKISEVWQFWDRLGILEQIGEVQVRTDPVIPGYYSEILKDLGMEAYTKKASLLTKRERDCLNCLLQGNTGKETAAFLNLSTRTVESYFENIKEKFKCSNKGELFKVAKILEKLELL